MKIWVLMGGWDYEGYDVIGVYSSKRKAASALKKFEKRPYSYQSLDLQSFKLDELP